MTEQELKEKYPPGFHVRFADANVTAQSGETVLAGGFIIGEAWEDAGSVWVPVWSRGEQMGASIVVNVHEHNILDVTGPQP